MPKIKVIQKGKTDGNTNFTSGYRKCYLCNI